MFNLSIYRVQSFHGKYFNLSEYCRILILPYGRHWPSPILYVRLTRVHPRTKLVSQHHRMGNCQQRLLKDTHHHTNTADIYLRQHCSLCYYNEMIQIHLQLRNPYKIRLK